MHHYTFVVEAVGSDFFCWENVKQSWSGNDWSIRVGKQLWIYVWKVTGRRSAVCRVMMEVVMICLRRAVYRSDIRSLSLSNDTRGMFIVTQIPLSLHQSQFSQKIWHKQMLWVNLTGMLCRTAYIFCNYSTISTLRLMVPLEKVWILIHNLFLITCILLLLSNASNFIWFVNYRISIYFHYVDLP